jgi:hypothetical protein
MYAAEFVEPVGPLPARNFKRVHVDTRSMWHAAL